MTEFTYVYTPLQEGHIRLLRLEWSSSSSSTRDHPAPNGSIRASLTHHDLSGPPPPYTALSYTWGDKKLEPPQTLNIVSPDSSVKTFPIHQENLYSFLRQARPDHLPADNGATTRRAPNVGYLWVDAISINQCEDAGKEEKVAQLKLMSRIYASACRLIIWLGPDKMNTVNPDAPFPENLWPTHPTGHAMTVYQRVAVAWASNQLPEVSRSSLAQIVDQVDRACIEAITRLPYWKRSWIYQEASTPNVPREFWLGGHTVWFEAAEVANRVFHSHMLELGLNSLPNPSPLNVDIAYIQELTLLRQKGEGGLSLLDLMVRTNSLNASEAVDKVYAMMNIARDIYGLKPGQDDDAFTAVRVDYELPKEDVYMNVACLIMETTKELDLLLFCSAGQYKGLKSWVPNFYRFVYSVPYRTRELYDAGGGETSGKRPRFSLNRDEKTLAVWGIKVDTVVGIYPSMRRPLQWGDYTSKTDFWQPIFGPWMRSLAWFVFPQPEGSVAEEAYIGGGTVSEAIDSALAWGMAPGYGTLKRDIDVTHWPLLEQVQASANGEEPEEVSVKRRGFQDFLVQTSAMAVFRTSQGYLGVGDEKIVLGDVVVVIPGLAVPLVLRTIPSYEPGGSPDGPRWRLVGPCYAKGIMDGEWLEKREGQEFVLI